MDWHLVDIDPEIWKRMDRIYLESGVLPGSEAISWTVYIKEGCSTTSECTSCRRSAAAMRKCMRTWQRPWEWIMQNEDPVVCDPAESEIYGSLF